MNDQQKYRLVELIEDKANVIYDIDEDVKEDGTVVFKVRFENWDDLDDKASDVIGAVDDFCEREGIGGDYVSVEYLMEIFIPNQEGN